MKIKKCFHLYNTFIFGKKKDFYKEIPCLFFLYFNLFNAVDDNWIWTADLWCHN